MNHSKLAAAIMAGITLNLAVQAADDLAATRVRTELPAPSAKQGVTFDTDIKPLFEASCVRCHGPERSKAKLRLDSREGVLKGSEEGPVLKAGDSAGSKLVIAVAQTDPELLMPPKPRKPRPGAEPQTATNQPPPPKPLTAEEVGLVRAWIDQGAK